MSRIILRAVCLSIVNIMMIVGVVSPGDWQASQAALNSADTLTPRIAINNESLMNAAQSLISNNRKQQDVGGKAIMFTRKPRSIAQEMRDFLRGLNPFKLWDGETSLHDPIMTYASAMQEGIIEGIDAIIGGLQWFHRWFYGRKADKSQEGYIFDEVVGGNSSILRSMLDRVGDKWDDVSYRIEGKLISIKQGFKLWYQDAPLLAKIPIGFVKGIFSFVVGLAKGIAWLAKGISWIARKILAPAFVFLFTNSIYYIYGSAVKAKSLLNEKIFPESVGRVRYSFSTKVAEIAAVATEGVINRLVNLVGQKKDSNRGEASIREVIFLMVSGSLIAAAFIGADFSMNRWGPYDRELKKIFDIGVIIVFILGALGFIGGFLKIIMSEKFVPGAGIKSQQSVPSAAAEVNNGGVKVLIAVMEKKLGVTEMIEDETGDSPEGRRAQFRVVPRKEPALTPVALGLLQSAI